jgi:hypothetical protein
VRNSAAVPKRRRKPARLARLNLSVTAHEKAWLRDTARRHHLSMSKFGLLLFRRGVQIFHADERLSDA